MSTLIMAACWPLQGMSASQKAVLISMADMANDDGVCWPSVGYISTRTCLSERAVRSAIKWLTEHGALALQERAGRSSVYTVTPAEFAPLRDLRGANNVTTPANNVTTPAAFAPTPANAAPITINNRKEPSGTIKGAQKKFTLPDWIDPDIWNEWDEFRKVKSGKAWTTKAKELSLRTLEKFRTQGHDPVRVIEQSIERGWTGFFEPKTRRAGTESAHNGFAKQNYHEGVAADGSF